MHDNLAPNTLRLSSPSRPRSKSASATSVSKTGVNPAVILANASLMLRLEPPTEPKMRYCCWNRCMSGNDKARPRSRTAALPAHNDDRAQATTRRWRCGLRPIRRSATQFVKNSHRTDRRVRCSTATDFAATSRPSMRGCGTSASAANLRKVLPSSHRKLDRARGWNDPKLPFSTLPHELVGAAEQREGEVRPSAYAPRPVKRACLRLRSARMSA